MTRGIEPIDSTAYLNKVHRHEPHEVLVFRELLEVLSDGDGAFWVGKWSVANAQPEADGKKTRVS